MESTESRSLNTVVVNFNSPELGYLAGRMASRGLLASYIRPYANKGRLWERALESAPFAGRIYSRTLGRRILPDPALRESTVEAGCIPDFSASFIGRLTALPFSLRDRWTNRLHERIRHAVACQAASELDGANSVVAYTGFGLPAFEQVRARGNGLSVLNYPIAHHDFHRDVRSEELLLEPDFARTWPGLDHWSREYESQVNAEIHAADIILVGSSYARDSFARSGVDMNKIKVVPYGVDLRTFSDSENEEQSSSTFKVIFAGQISQRKGISYLLKGYAGFHRADTSLTLVGTVMGDSDILGPFADKFSHIAHLPRSELAKRYRESDVFVFPTLLEGMGLVVLEAMACGLPVIVTANGPGDIVRDGIEGFVVPARDPEAIRDRLERLYSDPELRAEMSKAARARAQEFTWDAYGTRVEDLLIEGLASR